MNLINSLKQDYNIDCDCCFYLSPWKSYNNPQISNNRLNERFLPRNIADCFKRYVRLTARLVSARVSFVY